MASYVFKENASQVGEYGRVVNISAFSDLFFESAESSLCHDHISLTLLLDEIGHYRIAICYSASKP
jgi:hypothetical protein